MLPKLMLPLATTCLISCSQAFAAEEAKYEEQGCYTGISKVLQHSDGFMAGIWEGLGVSLAAEGNPFYQTAARCLGSFTVINGEPNSVGTCEFTNPSGDKFFGQYAQKGDPTKSEGTWHVVNGTGKFAGMSMDGKYIRIANLAPPGGDPSAVALCHREWGTYKLK